VIASRSVLSLTLLAIVGVVLPARGVELREPHYVMGTLLEITVEAPSIEVGRSWIRAGAAEAGRLDHELTSFDAESALSRLNRAAGRGFRRVPPDLFEVVALSQDLSRETNGVFDITVGPLVQLWTDAARDGKWPSPSDVEAARSRVGYANVRLRSPEAVELAIPDMALELGGIGKGYAADRIAALLRGKGAAAALVSFGESSIVAIGAPAASDGWPVWVRRGSGLRGPIFLRDAALSTSRALGGSMHVAGRAIAHIIDPRTGEPLSRDAQATVIAPTATAAEAWSKAVLLDPERSFSVIGQRTGFGSVRFAQDEVQTTRNFAALASWAPGAP
jgi:thiamine biosynthesis lipoprotein